MLILDNQLIGKQSYSNESTVKATTINKGIVKNIQTKLNYIISLIGILIIMSLTACSNKTEVSEEATEKTTQNVHTEQKDTNAEQETETMADDLPKQQGEISQSETTVIKNYNQDTAIELYVNVLRNYISAGKTDFTVSFIDLDDDSTREMVVFFGESQADGGYLFTIKNEEAIQVLSEDGGCFGEYGGFTYKEKGNVFITENEFVTDAQISNQIFYYTMEEGNAICNDVAQSITQFDSDESRFYINNTEVESEKFNSIAEKYGLLEMATVRYSDGVRVMNEQMDMVYNAYGKKDKVINTESLSVKQQESSTQIAENIDSEMTSEELLDLFINGSIDAIDVTDTTSMFNITDFKINSEKWEWDAYSIGERVDLDNDGENEQILCGPYGGIYLDARNNKVYGFAMGDGNANTLSYTYYNGEIWIMYSNCMNAGYEAYHMVKFEGADNIVAEINFSEELVDKNNIEDGMKYTWNGMEISYDEYAALGSKIFAAEVNTN